MTLPMEGVRFTSREILALSDLFDDLASGQGRHPGVLGVAHQAWELLDKRLHVALGSFASDPAGDQVKIAAIEGRTRPDSASRSGEWTRPQPGPTPAGATAPAHPRPPGPGRSGGRGA